ncbi:uncharacterized protein LOC114864498 isoform X2 [Betta splendens]|uniref:Uncharacterized protein LOC114864498 isoform X2 n=1 Tax=Betta splendens TaxID=158456 RepID=A0A9W2Y3A1_BETSP|nr:uncharacterized protein LOC114864498 isoform X2 [Betta splendens]
MTGLLAALRLLIITFLIQAQEVPPPVPVTVVHLGDAVTMKCSLSEEKIGLVYWYKLNFVYLIQTIAAGTYDEMSLKEEFNSSRFNVTKAARDYYLTIKHVSKADEALYFCQVGSAYKMTIRNSTVLAVNEAREEKVSVYVEQRPEAAVAAPGDPVDIQCSLLSRHTRNAAQCPGGHSVYWFRTPLTLGPTTALWSDVGKSCLVMEQEWRQNNWTWSSSYLGHSWFCV